MEYDFNRASGHMPAYRHNDGVEPSARSGRSRGISHARSRERYIEDSNASCCCSIRRIKDFLIFCIDAIVNFFCCRQNTDHAPVEKQPNSMCNQPDELTVDDWRLLDARWERECQAVEDIHAKCPPRPARIAFDLVDDVWNFNLDDIFRMHDREADSWEVLRGEEGWSYFRTNPFSEVIRFAGPDFSVEQLKRAFRDIYKKCPDNYQLNRYFSALINYMIRKKAWVDHRKVVRVTQQGIKIRTEDIEQRQDDRSRLSNQTKLISYLVP